MTTIVLEDGKITIPQEVREALGFDPGTVLEVQNEGGKLVAWKKTELGGVEKWRGHGPLRSDDNTEQYLRGIRDGKSG